MTQLEQLSKEELMQMARGAPLCNYSAVEWQMIAGELAKRLGEASKDSKAMDELADAFEDEPNSDGALVFKYDYWPQAFHPLSCAQIAKRK